MSLTLSQVLVAARDRSPWFHKSRVTDAVCARFLSDKQNEILSAANQIDKQYLAQTATIVVSLGGSNVPGSAGAGTSGGLPGTTDANGNFSTVQQTAGALVEANVTSDAGASVVVSNRVVTSSSATTVASTGAGRTTNQDVGRLAVIVAGAGIGQFREILSNTTDTWTISTGSDGQQWTTRPDTTSMIEIVGPVYASDNAIGAVTGLPATTTSQGYLVKLTAQGVPFIDFTVPLVATIDVGVPLPSMLFPLDGTVWYTDGSSDRLDIVDRQRRFGVGNVPAVYIDSGHVFLVGQTQDWIGVTSLCIRYAPNAPAFTALTDVFLLPDHARPVLVALAAEFMAMRVSALPDVTIDPKPFSAEASRAAQSYRATVLAGKRQRHSRVQELW